VAFQEPLDVFFADFNNNSDGQRVLFYPKPPKQVEAWLQEGNRPREIEHCYVRRREVLVETGDVATSQDETVLELKQSEANALGLAQDTTIDAEGKRFRLVTPNPREGLVDWKLQEVAEVRTATI